MLKKLFFIFVLALSTRARRNTTKYSLALGIVGGNRVHISKVPWAAIVINQKTVFSIYSQSYYCGGSIISKEIVLTAAHCVENIELRTSFIRVGSNYKTKHGKRYALRAHAIHPKYNSKQDIFTDSQIYDIGILWLRDKIKFSPRINYIQLPDINYVIPENSTGQICGFGRRGYKESFVKKLYCVNLTTVQCEAYYGKSERAETDKSVICAGSSIKSACNGDSGSGFVIGNKLIGIVAKGVHCGIYGHPTLFIKISSLKSWFDDNNTAFNSYFDIIGNILDQTYFDGRYLAIYKMFRVILPHLLA